MGKTEEQRMPGNAAVPDQFLADSGYDERPSELREVAHKLQRLEMVHYNPSDLGEWFESMLQELSGEYHHHHHQTPGQGESGSDKAAVEEAEEFPDAGFFLEEYGIHNYDFGEGMDGLFLPEPDPRSFADDSGSSSMEIQSGHEFRSRGRKRPRGTEEGESVSGSNPGIGAGVRLVHTLMACAEATQQKSVDTADGMVEQTRMLARSLGGPMGKVAAYFAEALARRIHGFPAQDEDSLSELLQARFYETCPYLKFAHFTANQAILEAVEGHGRVHVVDFNLKQGVQWPALIQALALRPGGPPSLRLTGIGNDDLHEVGSKLAHLAESINVEFDFRGYVDLKPWMLDVRPGEALAVNSIFELHRLLYPSDAANPAPVDEVLGSVRRLNPTIVTLVEQEADHNSPVFLERFTESLHYYSAMFDSLEACRLPLQSPEQVLSEMYLGREICNIVACEGSERVERHQTLMQWRLRMHGAGFRPLHLGSNAFKQASMLLTLFSGGDQYGVEQNSGCLTLGWHGRPLVTASAWQCC